MKFLIQTFEDKIKHDFSFTLIQSIEYQNWLRQDNSFVYVTSDSVMLPDYCPIGSVEFVCEYLKKYFGLIPKPINIPLELMKREYLNRTVINGTEKDISGIMFIKSNDKIKHFTEICDQAPEGNYQISSVIEIDSEWRAFIYQGKLVGLQYYSGEFTLFPDVKKIQKMIEDYTLCPIAYTLDVAISEGETVIIEVHDFFSCGLYGFSDHKILPFMFFKWFKSFTFNK
jgi:hypothetical protein